MSAYELPEGYVRCIEAMQTAAIVWGKQHPFATLQFKPIETDVAREAGRPGQRPAIVARLVDVIDRWADNADTRSFLLALEEASNGEATYLQARAIVDEITRHTLERAQGQMPASGDWRCTSCSAVNDGFTNAQGGPGVPGPGSISVCAYCGAMQRVNDTADGFVPLSTREFNQLPKSMRKVLLTIKRSVEERLADERGRS